MTQCRLLQCHSDESPRNVVKQLWNGEILYWSIFCVPPASGFGISGLTKIFALKIDFQIAEVILILRLIFWANCWRALVLITCTTQQTKKHAKIWKLKNPGNLWLGNRSSQMELPGRTESSRHGRPAGSPLNSPIHMLSLEIQIHLQSLWLQHRSIHIR